MHDDWTDQLSEYLDGELSPADRAAVEAHLAGCPGCADTLDDLRRVVATAQALVPRPPATDLWSGIAERMAAPPADGQTAVAFRGRQPWRISFTLSQLAAASVLLAAVSGGVAWEFRGQWDGPRSGGSGNGTFAIEAGLNVGGAGLKAQADASTPVPVAMVSFADAQYDAAVVDLEGALQKRRGRLDASTIAIVERNLEIIDRAIDQARQALESDPANTYLSSHLVETRRRKLDLLRRATSLAETN